MEVYDRKTPYHPSLDSIVRTEARRLRSKLEEYYESDGEGDPVFRYFRKGSYVPVFRLREKLVVEKFRQFSPEIALGDLQSTAVLLAEACQGREPELLWMGVDARFDRIRNMGQLARATKNCGTGV
jgi:hypothetical protein